MWTTFWRKLLGRNPTLVEPGVLADPANIPVTPAIDTAPSKVHLRTIEPQLRFARTDTLVLPGSAVVTKNNVAMKVARVAQKPPYVICLYKGRKLAVRADNIGCYWATVATSTEPLQ